MRSVYNLQIQVDGDKVKLLITTLNDSVTVTIDYNHKITIEKTKEPQK